MKFEELSGRSFGRLTVIRRVVPARRPKWLCACSCGGETISTSDSLKAGRTQSCGCLKAETTGDRFRKHGKQGAPEYNVWRHMKSRCHSPSNKSYADYGARGITVCSRWEKSFEDFYRDMGDRPSADHTLERVDVNAGYSPENCVWELRREQNRNKRNNTLNWGIVHKARALHEFVAMKTADIAKLLEVNPSTLKKAIYGGSWK